MPTEKLTFTYKTVSDNQGGQIPVRLDLHLPTQSDVNAPLKIVLYFHGGGLISGTRSLLPDHLQRAPDKYRVALISADYRLAPQARIPDIQDDAADCLSYIIHSLPSELSSKKSSFTLDTSSIALMGGSAGGYLAFSLALGMTRCPSSDLENLKVVCPLYSITDVGSDFFANPTKPFEFAGMGGYNLDPEAQTKFKPFVDPNSNVVTDSTATPYRDLLYFWAQEKALLPSLLYDEQSIKDGLIKKTSISHFVKETKEKKSQWKPVFISHGDKDTAVSVQQSRDVVESFRSVGFKDFVYEERKGTDHVFDILTGDEMKNMWDFVSRNLGL